MANEDIRTIALSQELIDWSTIGQNAPFEKGDKVLLKSEDGDWRCNGEFIVADAMNIRYRNRGDIFMMNRSDNTSCTADIYKLN